jgi:hypothetical protein
MEVKAVQNYSWSNPKETYDSRHINSVKCWYISRNTTTLQVKVIQVTENTYFRGISRSYITLPYLWYIFQKITQQIPFFSEVYEQCYIFLLWRYGKAFEFPIFISFSTSRRNSPLRARYLASTLLGFFLMKRQNILFPFN